MAKSYTTKRYSMEKLLISKLCYNRSIEQQLIKLARLYEEWINLYSADKIGAFLILIGQQANFIHWIGNYSLDKVIHSSYNRALFLNELSQCKTAVIINTKHRVIVKLNSSD